MIFIPLLAEVSPNNYPYPTSKQAASSLVPRDRTAFCFAKRHFLSMVDERVTCGSIFYIVFTPGSSREYRTLKILD